MVIESGRPLRFGHARRAEAAGASSSGLRRGRGSHRSESGSACRSGPATTTVGVVGFGEQRQRRVQRGRRAAGLDDRLEHGRRARERAAVRRDERLLTETNERAAELAIINSVQQGLAAKLDMQAMYDLVGDKIREIFDAQVVDIAVIDRRGGPDPLRVLDRARRPGPRGPDRHRSASGKHVLGSGEPLSLVNGDMSTDRAGLRQPRRHLGRDPKSAVFVPLIVGGVGTGVISLQNLDREDAFTESDVRLLTTLAASLSVALENARLFDETKRLLGRDRRARRRAGDHQQRPAGPRRRSSTCRRCTTWSATRSTRSSTPRSSTSSIYDRSTRDRPLPVHDRARRMRLSAEPMPLIGFRRQVVETQAPVLVNRRPGGTSRRGVASRRSSPGELAKSALFVAAHQRAATCSGILLIAEPGPRGRLQRSRRAAAVDLAASLSVALENARLFDETQRLLGRDRTSAAAELAIINSVQQGLADQARHAGDVRRSSATRSSEIFDAQVV